MCDVRQGAASFFLGKSGKTDKSEEFRDGRENCGASKKSRMSWGRVVGSVLSNKFGYINVIILPTWDRIKVTICVFV